MSNSTHAGKLQVTTGPLPIFLPALAVPTFKDNLVSVAQLARRKNVVFTNKAVYLTPPAAMDRYAQRFGSKGKDNLYTISHDPAQKSTLIAAPVVASAPEQQALHDTLNHNHPQAIRRFTTLYPKAAKEI